MLNDLYTRVSKKTKQFLYQYIKDENISLLDYNFKCYFEYCASKNNIKVICHHFVNRNIEGLTIIDKLGISFSYEKDNPKVKQNFTLCHELGHFILKHEGLCFTESINNGGSLLEREANVFSAVILMPDIVLLSKIYYSYDSFQKVQRSLEVSKQALYFRLLDLLRTYIPDKEDKSKQAIKDYIEMRNDSIHHLFHDIKEQIIEEFNKYKPSLKNQIQNRIRDNGYTSSEELPDLINQKHWGYLREDIKNLKIWLVYNKGKAVAYAWDSTKLSEQEARRKAELQLLLI